MAQIIWHTCSFWVFLLKLPLLLQDGARLIKQRRALLESNSPRNSQREIHRNDELGGGSRVAPRYCYSPDRVVHGLPSFAECRNQVHVDRTNRRAAGVSQSGFRLWPIFAPMPAPIATPQAPRTTPTIPPITPPATALVVRTSFPFSGERGARVLPCQLRAVRVVRSDFSRLQLICAPKRLFTAVRSTLCARHRMLYFPGPSCSKLPVVGEAHLPLANVAVAAGAGGSRVFFLSLVPCLPTPPIRPFYPLVYTSRAFLTKG